MLVTNCFVTSFEKPPILLKRFFSQHQHLIHLYFCDILLISFLIVIIPADEFSFDSYFRSFIEVFFYNLGYLIPGNQTMPLGFGYFFPFCIAIALIGSNAKPGEFFSGFSSAD